MLNRKIAPVFNSEFSFDLINPVSLTLPNNTSVHFINGGEQEVIKVELILRAGRWFEQTWGTSYFTTSLLSKGTKNKSSYEIAELSDYMGMHIESHAGPDFVSMSIYSLVKKIKPALSLLLEIVTEPVFPEKEIQQLKDIYLQNLKVNHEKTGFVASKLIRKNLFGVSHPYGKEIEENEVLKIDRNNLVAFHRNHFFDAMAIVSGKLSSHDMQAISDLLAGLNHRAVEPVQRQAVLTKPFMEYTKKEDSVQTSLRLAKQIVQRKHADYPLVLFLNHMLGGYFGSRLMKNLREDKGLTYGISSSIQAMKHNSYLVIGTDVNKENKELASEEIKSELKRLREEPIDAEEIETAKNHFIGSLQTELSTAFAHADKVKVILLHDLNKDFYQDLISRLSLIDAARLQQAANDHFREESFFEVSVG